MMSVVCHVDFMLAMEPVWSNIKMKYTWDINDEIAENYKLKGGSVSFEAQRFDQYKMYRMDPEYRGGCYGLDEINVSIADALKFNTNANFYFNKVDQQLRKDQNGLV